MRFRALFQTSDNDLVEFDYTQEYAIKIKEVVSNVQNGTKTGLKSKKLQQMTPQVNIFVNETADVTTFAYVNYADSVAVAYGDNTIVVANATYEGSDRQFRTKAFVKQQFDEQPQMIFECDDNNMFSVVYPSAIRFFGSTNLTLLKEIPYDKSIIINNVATPRDTKIMLLFAGKKLFFADLDAYVMIGYVSLPESSNAVWLEHPPNTDLFVSRENFAKTSTAAAYTDFVIHQLTANDPRFCHRTCDISWKPGDPIDYNNKNRYCPRDFTPCSLVQTLFYIGLIVAGVIMLVLIVARVICIYNSREKPIEEDYVEEESFEDGDNSIHVDMDDDNKPEDNMGRVF